MKSFFINIYILISIFFFFFSIKHKKKNYKIYPKNSLCGGFINDTMYYLDKDACNLPCKMNTTLNLISQQNNTFCSVMPAAILFDKNYIIALSNVTINQHTVVNRTYIVYQKKLLVYLH